MASRWSQAARSKGGRAFGLLIVAIALALLLQSGRPARVAEPGAAGPYAVGVTRTSTPRSALGAASDIQSYVWYPAVGGLREAPDPALLGVLGAPPSADGPHPVVVFSHGRGGRPQATSFLLSHLASHGFIVVGPLHDGDCAACPLGPANAGLLDEDLRRLADVATVSDDVAARGAANDPPPWGRADPARIGLAGWSSGGHTAVRLLETDPRFGAAVALAPATFAPPAADPVKVSRPLMLVSGDWDTNVPSGFVRGFFARIPAAAPDRFLIGIRGAGHSFANECASLGGYGFPPCRQTLPQERVKEIVKTWATAFLMRHVAGDVRYAAFLVPPPPGTDYVVTWSRAGEPAAVPARPDPLPGGEEAATRATELICRAGRTVPCGLLHAGATVQFAPLGGPGNFVYSPDVLTLDAGLIPLAPEDVASVLVAAATYAALDSPPSPSCADIGRAETEQALLWRWAYPDGRYPAGSPRTNRMRQIVAALGPDGTVQPRLDPLRAAECPG